MTEKEIEKLFKSKLDNREFAFNPANWEAMETILDSQPKPAGAFYWRSVLSVLLFGIAVWSAITFTPAAAESKMVNGSENISPVENVTSEEKEPYQIEEIQNDSRSHEPMVIEESGQVESAQDEPENVVAASPTQSTEPGKLSKTVAVQLTAETDDEEPAKAGEVIAEDAAPMEQGTVLPLSKKGFVFSTDLPQSLVEVTPGGHFTTQAFKKFDARSSFYLEAAPIFTGSYNANNVGVGWKAGLGWETAIGERLQFNIGLGYTVQNGVGIENNSDSVFYNFGKEVVETQVTDKRLDYIELPVSVGYKLNERNMIQLGMYAGYLVNVSRDVNKEISRFKSETEYESSELNGYQKEFRRMDYGLEFGYRYRLTPALSVGLHYNLGLIDITKNTQGDYLQRHTNQNTRVVFRYRFL